MRNSHKERSIETLGAGALGGFRGSAVGQRVLAHCASWRSQRVRGSARRPSEGRPRRPSWLRGDPLSAAGWGVSWLRGGPSGLQTPVFRLSRFVPDFDVSGKTAQPKMAFNFAHLLSAACGGAPRRLGRLRRPWARCARLFWGGYQHRKIACFLTADRQCTE